MFSPDIRRKTAALEQAGDFRFGQLSVKAAGKAVGQGLAPHGKGGLDNAEEQLLVHHWNRRLCGRCQPDHCGGNFRRGEKGLRRYLEEEFTGGVVLTIQGEGTVIRCAGICANALCHLALNHHGDRGKLSRF